MITYCSPVKVLRSSKDQCLVLRHLLDLVCPLSRNLDRRLNSFRTSIHGQHHIVSKHIFDLLRPFREDIVVEGAGREGKPLSLLAQCLHELGMAMPLVDSGVGREAVDVVLSLWVPNA